MATLLSFCFFKKKKKKKTVNPTLSYCVLIALCENISDPTFIVYTSQKIWVLQEKHTTSDDIGRERKHTRARGHKQTSAQSS